MEKRQIHRDIKQVSGSQGLGAAVNRKWFSMNVGVSFGVRQCPGVRQKPRSQVSVNALKVTE